jgi:coproporphyrinogen III oxidase-like Fe-S oxidoreductase
VLSERIISNVLGVLNRRYLATHPVELDKLPAPPDSPGFVLYAHVPFCERLCTYCSFNRFIYKEDRARAYFHSLRREMRMVSDLGYDFASLYVGGGTPTILLDELAETIDLARELFPGILEVSAETSPNHLNADLVAALDGRVQRLSCGVQSFDDRLLRQMDRFGKYGSGQEVFERVAAMAGAFPSFNVDMIFNFPSQTEDVLRTDIEMVKAAGANQTTFYPLMASPLRRRELAASVGAIDFDREAAYYDIVTEALAPEFEPGSAWTFSRDRDLMIDEYIVDFPEYVGIGSGALSYLGDTVYGNTFSLREYSERIEAGKMGVVKRGDRYKFMARMRYRFVPDLFGLRLDKQRFREDFGIPVDLGLGPEIAFLKLVGGIETNTAEQITLTRKGRYLHMVMMRETLATSNDARDKARAELPMDERVLLLEGDTSAMLEPAPALAG